MSSTIGNRVRLSIFGESHGEAIGCVLDGLPAGEALTLADSLSGCACGLLRRDGRLQVSRRWPAEA